MYVLVESSDHSVAVAFSPTAANKVCECVSDGTVLCILTACVRCNSLAIAHEAGRIAEWALQCDGHFDNL